MENVYQFVDYDYIGNEWELNKKGLANCQLQEANSKISNINSVGDFLKSYYSDQWINGFVMSYPHGVVIRQGETGGYYRGENKKYSKSLPTYFRKLESLDTKEDKDVYTYVSKMRIQEFKRLIDRTNIVNQWKNLGLDILYEPLAQHYGLDTTWLDITSDFRVALFFATCTYDYTKQKWRPLNKTEIETNKYGVIFSQTDYMTMIANQPYKNGIPQNIILPIGYQPFMRCHVQHGYGVKMDKPFPLQEDKNFKKLFFKHSEELSNSVFHQLNEGKSIYPNEGLNIFSDVIENIKTANCFNRDSFNIVFEEVHIFDTKEKAIEVLNKHEFSIDDENNIDYGATEERISKLNEIYKNFSIEKDYGITLSTRLCYRK